jgi:small ligand-binding sensory domain FIST
MIRAGSGLGRGDPAEAGRTAAREAVAGLTNPSLALVFASGMDRDGLGEALDEAKERLRGATIVGASGGGVIGSTEEVEGEPAVAVLAIESDSPGIALVPFLAPLSGDAGRDGDAVAAKLERAIRGPHERSFLVLLPVPARFDAGLLVRLRSRLGKLPVVGALSASLVPDAPELVFAGEERSAEAVAGVLITGEKLRAAVAVAQGCRPVVAAGEVTRSEGNVILEIDGKPALERLREAIEKARVTGSMVLCGIALEPLSSPLGGEDFLARNVMGIDPKRGGVAVADLVPAGARVTFLVRDAAAAREDMTLRARELAQAFPRTPPSFGLFFDCVARGAGLYGESNVDTRIIHEHVGDVPLAGFFGNGELAPFLGRNLVYGYTGVLLLVGES